jgi:hypothetical protein
LSSLLAGKINPKDKAAKTVSPMEPIIPQTEKEKNKAKAIE